MARSLALVFALASGALAQGRLGDLAPDFEASFLGSETKSLGELRGRVILLDFWRTWCNPCHAEVPHLNELAYKYKDQGLVVIGVTNEDEVLVRQSIAKTERKFQIARVSGAKADAAYGVTGFPAAFLIDPAGKIVWSGMMSGFNENMLPELLAQVLLVRPLPAQLKDANGFLQRGKFGKAHEAVARGLVQVPGDADLTRAKQEIEAALQRRMGEAKKLADEGELGRAFDAYSDVADQFSPMPDAQAAESAAEALRRDPAAKDELAAHAQYKKGQEQSAKGESNAAITTWKLLVKKYPATKAAKRATVALRQRGMI
ncbi:MAG: redoxin domain-containing protein [Planctomycetota bacterium]